ncbi:fluoride efflux transporter CrcB [Thalassolituus maritimus]|uniref:Fluoride-specific ion channel FluC n=1 Tax=Thalassolituus maritimus TaxID=484498 RepID=A0ABQ0A1I5_9GAMM
MAYFWIAIGGALGAMARFGMSSAVFKWFDRPFPYGTLSVNLLGSFAIGVAYIWLVENGFGGEQHRHLAMVGFLGAFTTFSTFSLESISLLQDARYEAFLAYIGASLLGCLTATAAGMWLSKSLV